MGWGIPSPSGGTDQFHQGTGKGEGKCRVELDHFIASPAAPIRAGMRGRHARSRPDSESYARYALGLLVVVYVLNFLDRQILSILAERIKADLGLSDAQIGFLYGTAFAVFYALFGIPLGRLADVWVRTRLIALGLAFWSLMTARLGVRARLRPAHARRASASASARRAPARRPTRCSRTTFRRRAGRRCWRSTRAASTSAPASASSSAA